MIKGYKSLYVWNPHFPNYKPRDEHQNHTTTALIVGCV